MCTAAAEVVSARKGHNGTPALQTLVQEHAGTSVCCVAPTCQLWGLPYPGGSSWDLTCTQVLKGFSPQEKMSYSKPTSAGSWDEANEQLWQMSSSRGKHDGNHNSCKGTKGPNPALPEHRKAQGSAHAGGLMGPAQLPAN